MDSITIIYFIITIPVILFFGMFGYYSLVEKKPRAAFISISTTLLLFVIFILIYIFDTTGFLKLLTSLTLIAFIILFFTPYGKKPAMKISRSEERFDERDTIFARNDYKPGTEKYDLYYSNNPEYKKIDDKLRSMPDLLESGGKYYNQKRAAYTKGLFELEEILSYHTDGEVNDEKIQISNNEATKLVKEKVLLLGASEVGIAVLDRRWIYSHVGRGPEKWGTEININHKFVICFTVEMDFDKISYAPDFSVLEESARQYINAQRISIPLANFIREMGYSARAHVSGSNYQIILPAVAYSAGLGELGRHGYLISKKHGARIRLGAVTTDLPLIYDEPVNLGVQDFCRECKKCAVNCLSQAITGGDKQVVRGVEKWQLNVEQCYRYWRWAGTDCALCMMVCPFSHPDNLIHNAIRLGISKSSFARKLSLWGDDLFYGKNIFKH